MKLFITGASGFLGRRVVGEALERGHEVHAVVRPASDLSGLHWVDHSRVTLVRLDLRDRGALSNALSGTEAVVHLAAAKSGDLYAQLAGTVVATENLLDEMDAADVRHIVAVSSFAVYDYLNGRTFSRLDESSPVEGRPEDRDEYCRTKLIQEHLIREHACRRGWTWTILRPGVIFGSDNLWTARLGLYLGSRLWVRIGAWAPVPLTYVDNCAEAIVRSTGCAAAAGQVLNIVDDEMPTQRRYIKLLQRRLPTRPRIIPIPWFAARGIARLAWLTNRLLLGGRAKVPSVLVPSRLHARYKPRRYSNARLKAVVGWMPRYGLAEALDRCFESAADPDTAPVPGATSASKVGGCLASTVAQVDLP